MVHPLPRGKGQQTAANSTPVVLAPDAVLPMPTSPTTPVPVRLSDGVNFYDVSKPSYVQADQLRRDCSTANLTASSDTVVIANTKAATRITVFNGTGISMILKVDSVEIVIVPPGGISEDVLIASGKAMTLNPYTTCTDGEIVINTFA